MPAAAFWILSAKVEHTHSTVALVLGKLLDRHTSNFKQYRSKKNSVSSRISFIYSVTSTACDDL